MKMGSLALCIHHSVGACTALILLVGLCLSQGFARTAAAPDAQDELPNPSFNLTLVPATILPSITPDGSIHGSNPDASSIQLLKARSHGRDVAARTNAPAFTPDTAPSSDPASMSGASDITDFLPGKSSGWGRGQSTGAPAKAPTPDAVALAAPASSNRSNPQTLSAPPTGPSSLRQGATPVFDVHLPSAPSPSSTLSPTGSPSFLPAEAIEVIPSMTAESPSVPNVIFDVEEGGNGVTATQQPSPSTGALVQGAPTIAISSSTSQANPPDSAAHGAPAVPHDHDSSPPQAPASVPVPAPADSEKLDGEAPAPLVGIEPGRDALRASPLPLAAAGPAVADFHETEDNKSPLYTPSSPDLAPSGSVFHDFWGAVPASSPLLSFPALSDKLQPGHRDPSEARRAGSSAQTPSPAPDQAQEATSVPAGSGTFHDFWGLVPADSPLLSLPPLPSNGVAGLVDQTRSQLISHSAPTSSSAPAEEATSAPAGSGTFHDFWGPVPAGSPLSSLPPLPPHGLPGTVQSLGSPREEHPAPAPAPAPGYPGDGEAPSAPAGSVFHDFWGLVPEGSALLSLPPLPEKGLPGLPGPLGDGRAGQNAPAPSPAHAPNEDTTSGILGDAFHDFWAPPPGGSALLSLPPLPRSGLLGSVETGTPHGWPERSRTSSRSGFRRAGPPVPLLSAFHGPVPAGSPLLSLPPVPEKRLPGQPSPLRTSGAPATGMAGHGDPDPPLSPTGAIAAASADDHSVPSLPDGGSPAAVPSPLGTSRAPGGPTDRNPNSVEQGVDRSANTQVEAAGGTTPRSLPKAAPAGDTGLQGPSDVAVKPAAAPSSSLPHPDAHLGHALAGSPAVMGVYVSRKSLGGKTGPKNSAVPGTPGTHSPGYPSPTGKTSGNTPAGADVHAWERGLPGSLNSNRSAMVGARDPSGGNENGTPSEVTWEAMHLMGRNELERLFGQGTAAVPGHDRPGIVDPVPWGAPSECHSVISRQKPGSGSCPSFVTQSSACLVC
eukprot:jgi/Botrbrau1/13987/Bobra.117_2s0017.1